MHGGEATHVGSRERHNQGGAEAVPFGVGHSNQKRVVRQGDEIEIVAAGFIGRIRGPSDIEAGYERRGSVEALLHIACQLQLKFLLLLFPELQ